MSILKKVKSVYGYYVHKAINRTLSRLIEKLFRFKNIKGEIFYHFPKNFQFSGKIVFCFKDSRLLHLGDQLFYEPIIRHLNKQFEVIVISSSMADYFHSLGYEIVDGLSKLDLNGSILISNRDALWGMFRRIVDERAAFATIDYSSPQKVQKVVKLITSRILQTLDKKSIKVNSSKINYQPALPKRLLSDSSKFYTKKNFQKQEKYFLFNNYVASNFKGVNKRKKDLIKNLALKKRKEGYKIIYIGSREDKKNDKNFYNFIDIDLRGKTTIADLFKIMSLDNVKGVISFDTFIMHVASLFHKDLYVVVRGKNSKKQERQIRQVFVPAFPGLENIVKCVKF